MTTSMEYALLSGVAYESTRGDKNKFPIPENWKPLASRNGQTLWHTKNGATGFEAVAFINGKNIVISFAGTYPGVQDFGADILLGVGKPDGQLALGAKYYQDIKKAYPDTNITFTGHSLGGGLAALMGVFFNKPAVTFDPAPFRKSATISNAMYLDIFLKSAGYPGDLDLAAFYATGVDSP